MLCSLELQTKISFTHQSRSSPKKEPLVQHSNFINLFRVVGKTPTENVTDRQLCDFFINHLKNSKQRFLTSLNRKRVHSKKRLKKKRRPRNVVTTQQTYSSLAVDGSSQEFNEVKTQLEEADIIVYDPIE